MSLIYEASMLSILFQENNLDDNNLDNNHKLKIGRAV